MQSETVTGILRENLVISTINYYLLPTTADTLSKLISILDKLIDIFIYILLNVCWNPMLVICNYEDMQSDSI